MKEVRRVKGRLALGWRECQRPAPLNGTAARADHVEHMRTIGFRSNILFAIAAAFGVVASLGRPWYGPSPIAAEREQGVGEMPSQMEDFFTGIGRAFSASDGTTGWAALQTADTLIAGLAVGTALLLLLTLVPPLQLHVQALARWTSLATFGVVLVKLVDEPGANLLHEPRLGLFIALGAAAVLVASSMTIASAPQRRRAPVKTYTPPPAPNYAPDSTYGPPQF
jgi:hypothetical protein